MQSQKRYMRVRRKSDYLPIFALSGPAMAAGAIITDASMHDTLTLSQSSAHTTYKHAQHRDRCTRAQASASQHRYTLTHSKPCMFYPRDCTVVCVCVCFRVWNGSHSTLGCWFLTYQSNSYFFPCTGGWFQWICNFRLVKEKIKDKTHYRIHLAFVHTTIQKSGLNKIFSCF